MPTEKDWPVYGGHIRVAGVARHCSTCRWRHDSRSAHGHIVGYYCDAPETKYEVAPAPATELITGEPDTTRMRQEFHDLFEHRSAGWFMARFKNLCGREGRWWERDPKTLTPPNCAGSAVKPPPPLSQFEKRLGV